MNVSNTAMFEIIRKGNSMNVDVDAALEQARVHALNSMIDAGITAKQSKAISDAISSMITDTLSAINENQDNVQF